MGIDVHQWNLNLLEGENLTIDLYNVEPYVSVWGLNRPFMDGMDTKLYLLDAKTILLRRTMMEEINTMQESIIPCLQMETIKSLQLTMGN